MNMGVFVGHALLQVWISTLSVAHGIHTDREKASARQAREFLLLSLLASGKTVIHQHSATELSLFMKNQQRDRSDMLVETLQTTPRKTR